MDIDPKVIQLLLSQQEKLPDSGMGLKFRLQGDICHGLQVTLFWGTPIDRREVVQLHQGIRFIATPHDWLKLQGAKISAGECNAVPGLWIALLSTPCQCESACGAPSYH